MKQKRHKRKKKEKQAKRAKKLLIVLFAIRIAMICIFIIYLWLFFYSGFLYPKKIYKFEPRCWESAEIQIVPSPLKPIKESFSFKVKGEYSLWISTFKSFKNIGEVPIDTFEFLIPCGKGSKYEYRKDIPLITGAKVLRKETIEGTWAIMYPLFRQYWYFLLEFYEPLAPDSVGRINFQYYQIPFGEHFLKRFYPFDSYFILNYFPNYYGSIEAEIIWDHSKYCLSPYRNGIHIYHVKDSNGQNVLPFLVNLAYKRMETATVSVDPASGKSGVFLNRIENFNKVETGRAEISEIQLEGEIAFISAVLNRPTSLIILSFGIMTLVFIVFVWMVFRRQKKSNLWTFLALLIPIFFEILREQVMLFKSHFFILLLMGGTLLFIHSFIYKKNR